MPSTPASCFVIHTDGSAAPNPGPGGWGAVVESSERIVREIRGGSPFTTNNRMELTAVIEALRSIPLGSVVRIVSDSRYVIGYGTSASRNAQRRRRRRRPNQDLLIALADAVRLHQSVEWQWVRGHNGNAGNARADKLANLGRREK